MSWTHSMNLPFQQPSGTHVLSVCAQVDQTSGKYKSSPPYIISGRKQDMPFPITLLAEFVCKIPSIQSKINWSSFFRKPSSLPLLIFVFSFKGWLHKKRSRKTDEKESVDWVSESSASGLIYFSFSNDLVYSSRIIRSKSVFCNSL